MIIIYISLAMLCGMGLGFFMGWQLMEDKSWYKIGAAVLIILVAIALLYFIIKAILL